MISVSISLSTHNNSCINVGPLFLHGTMDEVRDFAQQIMLAADRQEARNLLQAAVQA